MPSLITSVGLTTNLGSVVHAAAAQRAGIVRRSPLADHVALDLDTEMEAPVIGAPIAGVTDGFIPPGLWLRLASSTLEDLMAYGGLPPAGEAGFWRRTGVTWVLPEPAFERFLWPDDEVPSILQQTCVAPLLDLVGLPVARSSVLVLPAGSAGVVPACHNAVEVLRDGGLDRIIVLATDSWLDPLSMRTLAGDGRIKSDTQPAGLCPGEAGGAVLLETASGAAARAASGQAVVVAGAHLAGPGAPGETADPAAARIASAQDTGRRLAAAIEQVLAEAGVPSPFRGTLMLDLTGEEWRAHAWGWAQALLTRVIDFDQCSYVIPAIEFGDTGAAAGVLGICLATRGFARGYARSAHTLVCTVSESGAVGALVVAAA